MRAVTIDGPERLRQRAITLRHFADDMQHAWALALGPPAGHDTWIGPTADACRDDLTDVYHRLLDAAADVVATAHWFERRAEAMEGGSG